MSIFTIGLYSLIYTISEYFADNRLALNPDWPGNDFVSLTQNIFLVQNIGFQKSLTWNYPAWSISVEFWVNILLFFALSWLAIDTKIRKTLFLLAIVFVLCYTVLSFSLPHLGSKSAIIGQIGSIFNTGLLRGIAGISLGVVCYCAIRKLTPKIDKDFSAPANIIRNSLEIILFLGIFFLMRLEFRSKLDFAAILLFALLLVLISVGRTSVLRSILSMKPITFFGLISYSIYLCHAPLLQFFKRWNQIFDENHDERFILFVFILSTVSLATLLYHFVEKPGQKWFKGIWDKFSKLNS